MTENTEHAMEFAICELIRFADANGVDLDYVEVAEDIDGPLGRLVTRIQRRDLVIEDDDGELVAVYRLRKPQGPHKESRFTEPTGAMFRELDKRGTGEENHKALQCFAAAIVRTDPKTMANMLKRDLTVHTDMAKLFLG